MDYVLLLRGINVGAHHRVKMSDVVSILEVLNYKAIEVLGNSGNIIAENEKMVDCPEIEHKLMERCGFEVPVVAIPANTLLEAFCRLPDSWNKHKDNYYNVLFAMTSQSLQDIVDISEINDGENDVMILSHNIIFWSSRYSIRELKRQGKDAPVLVSKQLMKMTVRSANTLEKIIVRLKLRVNQQGVYEHET